MIRNRFGIPLKKVRLRWISSTRNTLPWNTASSRVY